MVEDDPRPHRHDGTSPLPLSMDASPAPLRWTGAHTTWPHDPRTGWSYCVMMPSWISLPDSKKPDAGPASPTVFYRVEVGVQSPHGISTLHELIRRFSDFLKLHIALKHTFPKKKLPVPPPKKSLTWMLTSKSHLQQRRLALLDWITRLLSDIEVSRSTLMASFLELEVAARVAFSDTAYSMQDLEDKLTGNMESVSLDSETVEFGQGEKLAFAHMGPTDHPDSTTPQSAEGIAPWQAHRHSVDSDTSESSFLSGSEFSYISTFVDGMSHNVESAPGIDGEILKAVHALMPVDQRGYVRRVLSGLQRSVTMAKADMHELLVRLNQETSVKDFLTAKVRDLEVEAFKLKQTTMEQVEQAVSEEREFCRNLQWELEECRTVLARAEEDAWSSHKARTEAEDRVRALEMENATINEELQEMKERLQFLQVESENIKTKLTAETKVLAKEVKALRKSLSELKQKLDEAMRRKRELEAQVKLYEMVDESRVRILQDVGALCERLQQCTVDFLAKEDAGPNKSDSAIADATDLLMTSDSRIGLLLAEAQLLAEEEECKVYTQTKDEGVSLNVKGSNQVLRKLLTALFIDNARLHKLVNSLTLKGFSSGSKDKVETSEGLTRKSVLNRFL